MLRSIWKIRNGALFEDQQVVWSNTLSHGVRLAADFERANSKESEQERSINHGCTQQLQQQQWRPQQLNFLKITSDGAWWSARQEGATGAIARDSKGRFIGASFRPFQWVSSPLVAEAQALRDGLHLAWRLNSCQVELESDSKQLIQMLNGRQRVPFEVDAILGDIHHLTNLYGG
ncbi:hypothetical protein LIER_41521 [Lithospermum erythrorhizon]|uniref:RNase H type-1 domain-containing protein n=1 Tax=Lithospermum erythrorhizon TaxID=34254 RepID=A0AAV3RE07_LITER